MITTTARRITAALVLSGALCGLGAGMASAATPAAPVADHSATSPAQSDGSTGITMVIDNTTGTDLKLVSVTNGYGHMKDRPSPVLPGGASTTASDYSWNLNGQNLDVQYATPSGAILDFWVSVPLTGDGNTATGTSSDPALTITATNGTGDHPTDVFTVAAA